MSFRQALALDERRGNFIPCPWDHRYTQGHLQTAYDVWFRGEHSDIGGGSIVPKRDNKNPTDPYKMGQDMLSNITLRWMVRQCFVCKTGILFDPIAVDLARKTKVLEQLEDKYLRGQPEGDSFGLHYSRMNASAALDQKDAESHDIYNSIAAKPLWNILEVLPGPKPTTTLEPGTTWWPNLWKGRGIYGEDRWNTRFTSGIRIHNSVVKYMSSEAGKDYWPRAKLHWKGDKYPWVEDLLKREKLQLPDAVVERFLA